MQERALFGIQVDRAGRLGIVQSRGDLFEGGDEALRFLVAARAGGLGALGELLVHAGEVGERKLGVDGFDIRNRIECAGDMHDVVVGKAANDVRDRIGLADIRQELIAESLAFRRAGDEARDVDELHRCRNCALRPLDRGQRGESRIGNLDDTHVGLDSAEGIVFRRNAGLGESVEQCRLADVRQADDAAP